jgi:mannose-6-phosphate isomerase-like protein (cupin superfamily)
MLSDPAAALRGLCAALTAALDRAASLAPDAAAAAGFGGFAALVSDVSPAATVTRPRRGSDPPVSGFWAAALDAGESGAASPCVPSLRALGPHLDWRQNPNYRRQPPDPRFLDHYGYAVLVGPPDDPPPHVADSRLALGILLLGPGTHYPRHHHPAEEVYAVVSGDAEWRRGDGPWRREPPGALIHHAPGVPHATRTGARPLLVLYLWRGDLATHARLDP